MDGHYLRFLPAGCRHEYCQPHRHHLLAIMMFENAFGLSDEAQLIRDAVEKSIAGGIVCEDIARKGNVCSTSQVGDWICEYISRQSL